MPSDHTTDEPPSGAAGRDPGFDEEALYRTVRRAVSDAIIDAVGTIVLVGIGTGIGLVGASFLLRAATERGLPVPALAAGVWLVAVGFYLVASTLGIVQPVRDWF